MIVLEWRANNLWIFNLDPAKILVIFHVVAEEKMCASFFI